MHIMIDLETMGIRPSSAIVSIGAVHFNETAILGEFYTAVSLKSCTDLGLTTDSSTVDWWLKQSAEARAAWQRDDAPSLEAAMIAFTGWINRIGLSSQIRPWGNGADFDLVLLINAYRALNADAPWKFWNHRCFRTVKGLFPIPEIKRQGVHHNALDDAKTQAVALQTICRAHDFRLS